jgi:hypothetical protein
MPESSRWSAGRRRGPDAEELIRVRPGAARRDLAAEADLPARAIAAGRPDLLGVPGLLGLQRTAGNAAVGRMLQEDRSPVLDVVGSGGGRPLDPATRTDMEARLGTDLGDVRIHTGGQAHESATAVNALAYTVGSDVVFQQGRYDPSSTGGRTLLAHELVHVQQQRAGAVAGTANGGGIQLSDPADRFEQEAANMAERLVSAPSQEPCCDSCADGGQCESGESVDDLAPAGDQHTVRVFRQQVVTPGGNSGGDNKCLDLLQAIIDLLDEVAKRFRDAQDDPHELFKYHRHLNEADPDHGSWDGHRDKYNEKREELRRKIAEWEADDDCGDHQLSEQQQEDLDEAREFGDKEFPTKPARALREMEESEQESIWDKLRKPLPNWVVDALIVLGAIAIAVALVVAFATGVGEVGLAIAGVGLVLGLAIKAALSAAGVRDTSGEA